MKSRFLFFDVDGTLTNEECFTPKQCTNATPNKKYVSMIKERYEDTIIFIYTARRDNLIPATFEWLRKQGIRWHWFSNIKNPLMGGKYIDADNI